MDELNPALARILFHFRVFVITTNAWSVKKHRGERYPKCQTWSLDRNTDIVLHLPVFTVDDVGLFILFLEKWLRQDAARITNPGEVTTFGEIAELFPLPLAV